MPGRSFINKNVLMGKTFILFTFLTALAIITLNSYSDGPAILGNINGTGGPGSGGGTCAGCHSGGSGVVTGTGIVLKKKSDNSPANGKYLPGETYTLTVNGTHANPKFGFQLMALKQDSTQAGTFSNLGNDKHTMVLSGVTFVEHHHTLSRTGNDYTVQFDWKAPAAGSSDVTFYGIINAVDGTGSAIGDVVSAPFNLTLAESTSHVNEFDNTLALHLYPNPARDILYISLREAGTYMLTLYNINGKVAVQRTAALYAPGNIPLSLIGLSEGNYFLNIANGDKRQTLFFLKQ